MLVPLNRMVISFDGKLKQEAEPVDHFTIEHPNPHDMIKNIRSSIAGDTVQILTKSTAED